MTARYTLPPCLRKVPKPRPKRPPRRRCRTCRTILPPKTGPGRPRLYCDETCRENRPMVIPPGAAFHLPDNDQMPLCKNCQVRRATKGLYGFCSTACRLAKKARARPFGGFDGRSQTAGRTGSDYAAAVAVVRARAKEGEGCYMCGGGFNWDLPYNHRAAFTAHHLDRLMDGGSPVCSPDRMAPAHRGCNGRDGLIAMNQRRNAQRRAEQPATTPRGPSRRVGTRKGAAWGNHVDPEPA